MSTSPMRCDWCNVRMERPFWQNLVKAFCSLECTNDYLTSEGFETIERPTQSAKVAAENDTEKEEE